MYQAVPWANRDKTAELLKENVEIKMKSDTGEHLNLDTFYPLTLFSFGGIQATQLRPHMACVPHTAGATNMTPASL